MSDFSQSPLDVLVANQQKGYVGIHIQQGVPLLDRDLNLLHDLVAATVRSLVTRYIGNGVPAGADGFAITALPASENKQNFRIEAGTAGSGACLVGGIEVAISANTTYKDQPGAVALTTPGTGQPNPRTDTVYLDVSLMEVDESMDPELTNSQDVGMSTSVRLKTVWSVCVAEGATTPPPAKPNHTHYPLAWLKRPHAVAEILPAQITDLRQTRLNLADMEQRLSLMEKVLLAPAFAKLPVPQFIPRSSAINQLITLYGTNLNVGATQVRFGNVPATIVGEPSPTQIVVKVPAGLTPAGEPVGVKITISNAGFMDTSDDTFTVLAAPIFADAGQQFSPNHGPQDTQIKLNGHNFNAGTPQVQFGKVPATIVGTPTANQIIVQVPADLVPAGSTSADVQIKVTTARGIVTSDDSFRAEMAIPAPLFATPPSPQFIPRSGVGNQLIRLLGQNFNFAPVTVKFDNTEAKLNGLPSATEIVVQVPPNMIVAGGASKGVKITVTTPGGSVTSTEFTVTGP